MEIRAFTDTISDTAVRYQMTKMRDTLLLFVSHQTGGGGGGDTTAATGLPSLAMSMRGTHSNDGLPAATLLLGPHSNSDSERLAARLAQRCGLCVFASIDVGPLGHMAVDAIFARVIREVTQFATE